jgi:hypothetical protein
LGGGLHGPRLVGLVRTTIRNMLTDCLRTRGRAALQPGDRSLSKSQRAVYENEVLEPIAGLHKLGSQVADGAEDMARGDDDSTTVHVVAHSYSKA